MERGHPARLRLRAQGAPAHHPLRPPRQRRRPRAVLLRRRAHPSGQAGPLFFQLPPTLKKETARLADTLYLVPPDVRCAFEFRHASWFADDVYEVLRARNAALCIADNEEGATSAVATADWGYLRLRAVEYSDAALAGWVETVRGVGAGWRDAFVFFKHEDAATGPLLARRFEALAAARASA